MVSTLQIHCSYLIEVLLQRRVLPEEETAEADLVGGAEHVHVLVEEVDDRLAVVHLQAPRMHASRLKRRVSGQ